MHLYVRNKLKKEFKELIAEMLDQKLIPDPSHQAENLNLTCLHEKYKHLSGAGMINMGQEDYKETNLESCSLFYEPNQNTP